MTPIISLQISDELHERFEKIRSRSGFASKSEALRESIVKFIEQNEAFGNLEGYKIMTINLSYPFKKIINDEIIELYSRYNSIIKTTMDWRIAEKKIEILLLVGEIELIRDLYHDLANLKEVSSSINEIVID